jgi:hypothetical protein
LKTAATRATRKVANFVVESADGRNADDGRRERSGKIVVEDHACKSADDGRRERATDDRNNVENTVARNWTRKDAAQRRSPTAMWVTGKLWREHKLEKTWLQPLKPNQGHKHLSPSSKPRPQPRPPCSAPLPPQSSKSLIDACAQDFPAYTPGMMDAESTQTLESLTQTDARFG